MEFKHFHVKSDPETETRVLGYRKTQTESKIPQHPNTIVFDQYTE